MTSGRYLVLLLIVAGMIASACDDTSTSTTTVFAQTTSTTTTTVATATTTEATTTSTATTTTTTVTDIPYPDTTGDDWTRIASEIIEFGGWLYENPKPALVELTTLPDSKAYENFHGLISEYASNGWRDLPGGRGEFRAAEVQNISTDGTLANVLIVDDFDGAVTVDADGNIVKEETDRPPSAWNWKLRLTEDGWKVIEVTYLGVADWEDE